MKPRVGVLALQGAFGLHRCHLEAAGAEYVEISAKGELEQVDALILPGGESGVMLKLIDALGMGEELVRFCRTRPTWGICAGAILLARSVSNPEQRALGAIDIAIERNAYGRQVDSLEDVVEGAVVSYIRAPRVARVGAGVRVWGWRGDDPSWVESGLAMAITFHPETGDLVPSPWHVRLVEKCLAGEWVSFTERGRRPVGCAG